MPSSDHYRVENGSEVSCEGDEHGAAVTLAFVLPEFTTH